VSAVQLWPVSHKLTGLMIAESTVVMDVTTAFSVAGFLYLLSAGAAVVHVLLNKHNVSAAFSWIAVIVLSPFFGVVLYWLFGINRIRRRAQAEMRGRNEVNARTMEANVAEPAAVFSNLAKPQQQLFRTGLSIHDSPFLDGNQIDALINGTEAFPEMLAAIVRAKKSIVLSSYIFEYDTVGKQFVTALGDAHKRGVSVFVSIDGLGVGYGFSVAKADRMLQKLGVPTTRFLPTFSASGTRFINLRNHRKILSVDGEQAFVGGMNIRAGNLLDEKSPHQAQDVHFSIRGPAIDQINRVFEDDWLFATRESISLPSWQGPTEPGVTCRVLLDGPDDNYQKLALTIIAAINSATRKISIATPYFLPDVSVVHALHLAVLRGVDVRVLIPDKNNLFFVDWAMSANESTILKAGIKLYRGRPPFDHSKLFVVDNCWSLIGSSNWDARSIELNFEINVECYSETFAQRLDQILQEKFANAKMATSTERSLLIGLRNNFCRLFTPYL